MKNLRDGMGSAKKEMDASEEEAPADKPRKRRLLLQRSRLPKRPKRKMRPKLLSLLQRLKKSSTFSLPGNMRRVG